MVLRTYFQPTFGLNIITGQLLLEDEADNELVIRYVSMEQLTDNVTAKWQPINSHDRMICPGCYKKFVSLSNMMLLLIRELNFDFKEDVASMEFCYC